MLHSHDQLIRLVGMINVIKSIGYNLMVKQSFKQSIRHSIQKDENSMDKVGSFFQNGCYLTPYVQDTNISKRHALTPCLHEINISKQHVLATPTQPANAQSQPPVTPPAQLVQPAHQAPKGHPSISEPIMQAIILFRPISIYQTIKSNNPLTIQGGSP